MKNAALRSCSLALGLALFGSISTRVEAVDAYTDPVGYYTLNIIGGSDNVMSLPMVRDAVFSGTVGGGITATGFDALAGAVSPGWTVSQFKYVSGTQPQTFYVEFTSGALKGLYYKINDNTANSASLDTEGDSLLNHSVPGNTGTALAVGDSFKIRPYWRIKDVFEVNGTPIIESRPSVVLAKDDVMIPNYSAVGINKAATTIIFHTTQTTAPANGPGWRAAGQGATDFGDYILRPNEAFIVRRRNANNVSLTNLGGVLMNKSVSFVPGGDGSSANDIYISINRPAAVSLDSAGLRIADQSKSLIKDSASSVLRQDELYAFDTPAGFNQGAPNIYYYLAGNGWRKVGSAATDIGSTVFLEPGKSYIVRKKAANAGSDWANDANY